MSDENDRAEAIERIRSTLADAEEKKPDGDTVAVMRDDLHLLFDELERLLEMEDDAYHAGLERDLLT